MARTFEQNQVSVSLINLFLCDIFVQQVFMSASEISLTNAVVPIGDGVRDIYGISIPEDMCEDAMESFASSVNAFMERKFEVHNVYTAFDRHKLTSVTGAQRREQVV